MRSFLLMAVFCVAVLAVKSLPNSRSSTEDLEVDSDNDNSDQEEIMEALLREYENDYGDNNLSPLKVQLRHRQRIAAPGEVSSVALDTEGGFWLFHRADRNWTTDTFNDKNEYTKKDKGPIESNTLLRYDLLTDQLERSWGANLFYLPHGLTVDLDGNFWITDVARHQVFKFDANNLEKPAMVLGKEFQPGNDAEHFCQPTDVAVATDGTIFVADGYCNQRVVKFSRNGVYLDEWSDQELSVVHSIALLEDLDKVCVADRENSRVVCYRAGLGNANQTGELLSVIKHDDFGRMFSLDLKDGLLFVLTSSDNPEVTSIFAIDPETDQVVPVLSMKRNQIKDKDSDEKRIETIHDMAILPMGKTGLVVALAELTPHEALVIHLKPVD